MCMHIVLYTKCVSLSTRVYVSYTQCVSLRTKVFVTCVSFSTIGNAPCIVQHSPDNNLYD